MAGTTSSPAPAVALEADAPWRLFGCGGVMVVAPGAGSLGGMLSSAADGNRLTFHSLADHERLASELRARLVGGGPQA